MDYDVIVLGAGAAGLIAAACAAERGRRTLLLEKNRRAGVKILMSGGTRCNITHATDNRGIVEAYGPSGRFLHSALAAFGVEETIDFFNREGVATKVEDTGKVFPVSNRAADVLDALLKRLTRSGAALSLGEPILELERAGTAWSVITPIRTLSASSIILTVGGCSYPGSGTTGDGYRIASKFGHTIVPPRPALVPIKINAPWVAALRGITIPDIRLRVLDSSRTLAERRGSMLFAHFGLSGPVALDISRAISGHPTPQALRLCIDFLPNIAEPALEEQLKLESIQAGKKQLASVLSVHWPRRLAEALLANAGLAIDRQAAALTRSDRQRLVACIKRLDLPVIGTLGFEKAEVTAGGIALDEVDSRTCESKLQRGLFIAGEVLDLDGPIGGYNFQAAWSTGYLAGSHA